MKIEEMTVLIAVGRRPDVKRPELSRDCANLYSSVLEERVWLIAIDACIAKGWVDAEDFSYRLSRRGKAVLEEGLRSARKLVDSAQWVIA